MVQHRTSNQYLTSGKVQTRSIKRLRRNRLLKTLKLILWDGNVNADTMVSDIALSVLSYRLAKNRIFRLVDYEKSYYHRSRKKKMTTFRI